MQVKKLSITSLDRDKDSDCFFDKWCLSYDELFFPKSKEYVNHAFVFDKRFHLESDRNTKLAYKKFLIIISNILNKKISRCFPIDFWEIIIGHWLRQYLDVVYQRYEHVKSINFSGYRVEVICPDAEIVPFDCDEFSTWIFGDYLNHQIIGQIIVAQSLCEHACIKPGVDIKNVKKLGRPRRNRLLLKLAASLSRIMCRNSRTIIANGYVSKTLLIRNFIKRRWTPVVYAPRYKRKALSLDRLARELVFSNITCDEHSDFEKVALTLLSRNFPIIFFEEIEELIKEGENSFPNNLKMCITANPNSLGELFKVWIAFSRLKNHGKFIIIQHGSNYGQSIVNSDEDVELGTCDLYLSSGWKDDTKSNQFPDKIIPSASAARLSGVAPYNMSIFSNKSGKFGLLILASFPRYYYTGWSAPQGSNFKNYLNGIEKLYISVESKFRKSLMVRDYHYDYGWHDRKYLEGKGLVFFNTKRRISLSKLMKKSSYNIFTYNSTALNESLVKNYVTLCMWNPDEWAWRKSAIPALSALKEASIFHETPESLAQFLNSFESEYDLRIWWASVKVQLAREVFCASFANNELDEDVQWSSILE